MFVVIIQLFCVFWQRSPSILKRTKFPGPLEQPTASHFLHISVHVGKISLGPRLTLLVKVQSIHLSLHAYPCRVKGVLVPVFGGHWARA